MASDAKGIIPLLRAFHVYTQILVFLAAPGIKLQLQLALGKYTEHLMMLYTLDSVRAYNFEFHQARILGVDMESTRPRAQVVFVGTMPCSKYQLK